MIHACNDYNEPIPDSVGKHALLWLMCIWHVTIQSHSAVRRKACRNRWGDRAALRRSADNQRRIWRDSAKAGKMRSIIAPSGH